MLNKETASKFFSGAQNMRVAMRHITCPKGFCLVVEDDEHISKYLIKVLTKFGMETKVVDNSKDALEVLDKNAASIICAIVDLNLETKEAGKQVVDNLENQHRNIPYVVYTGDMSRETRLKKEYPHINVAIKGRNNTQILLQHLGLVT